VEIHYGGICLGKGVRNNHEFVISVFKICMNAYNGKDREKSTCLTFQFIAFMFIKVCCTEYGKWLFGINYS